MAELARSLGTGATTMPTTTSDEGERTPQPHAPRALACRAACEQHALQKRYKIQEAAKIITAHSIGLNRNEKNAPVELAWYALGRAGVFGPHWVWLDWVEPD